MFSILSRSACFSKCLPYKSQSFSLSSKLPALRMPCSAQQWHNRTYASHSTSSSSHKSESSHGSGSHAPWAIISALVFVPALLYLTAPPSSHYENTAANSNKVTNEPPNKITVAKVSAPEAFPYVLVGGGTASYNAIRGIQEVDPNVEILLITDEDYPPYERPPLSKELWFSGDKEAHKNLMFTNWQGQKTNVFYKDEKEYGVAHPGDLPSAEPGVKLMKNTKVIQLDPDQNTLTLSSGDKLKYHKLFLGLGGTPKWYPGAPRDHPNVLTFRNISDLRQLWDQLEPNKRVAVIGGGFLGSELAIAITNKCRVSQYFPESGILENVLPSYLSKWIVKQLGSEDLEIVPDSLVTKLDPSVNDQVVVHFNHSSRPFDVVLMAMGIEPNTDLAKSAHLEIDPKNKGIVVNSQFQAAHNIWCAGDNVSFYDPLLATRRRVEHYDHASITGYAAGKGMAGQPSFHHPQSMFWSSLGPMISMEAIGLVDASLETVGVWKEDEKDNGKKEGIVFYSRQGEIVGTLLLNLPGQLEKARDIIHEHHPISKSKELAKRFNLYDTTEKVN